MHDFLIHVEQPLIPATISMELSGFTIDSEKINGLKTRLEERKLQLEGRFPGINLNSPKQLKTYLIGRGYERDMTVYLTSGQAQSTNKTVLKALAMKHAEAKDILEYREVTKLLNTYVKPMSKVSRWTGNFNQCGTITGRYSSSKPNLQNIPNRTLLGKEIRGCLNAGSGYKFIVSDLSQIEPRLYAFFSQDPKLKAVFAQGRDFHSAVTEAIYGRSTFTKEERFVGKTVGLATLYGASAKRLKETLFNYGVDLSLLKVSQIRNQILYNFRHASNWAKQYEKDARTRGYVETLLGRRIPLIPGMNAVNTLIQGSCADVIKACMLNLYSMGYELVAQIHDEIVIRIKDQQPSIDSSTVPDYWKVKETMETSVRLEGIPIVAETRESHAWGI